MIHNETMLKDASKIMTSMLSNGQWEACRKPFEAAIKFIETSVNYQGYYTHLYEGIKKALGEERFKAARDEVLDSGNAGMDTMLIVAIEKLRDDAGDFDTCFCQVD